MNYEQNQTAIERLTSIIQTSKEIGIAIALILGIASVLIAFNTIRLAIYTARDEIAVMNLVGASHWYVRGPFIIAGVLYGLISGLVVLLLLYPITVALGPGSQEFLVDFNVFTYFVGSFPASCSSLSWAQASHLLEHYQVISAGPAVLCKSQNVNRCEEHVLEWFVCRMSGS